MKRSLYEAYAHAKAAEKAAWEAVKDRLPGTPDYSDELWQAWRESSRRNDEARRALVAAIPVVPRG